MSSVSPVAPHIRYDGTHLDPERMAFVLPHLADCRTVADVGCGGGKYSIELARRGFEVRAYDHSMELLTTVRERASTNGLKVDTARLDLTRLDEVERILEICDALCLFDILEHLHEDALVLRTLAQRTRKVILINVPAETPRDWQQAGFNLSAYSDLDHKRYYTENSVRDLIQRAGLKVVQVAKINPVFPQSFLPLLFDERDWRSRLVRRLLAGRTKSVTYRREFNSIIAAATLP